MNNPTHYVVFTRIHDDQTITVFSALQWELLWQTNNLPVREFPNEVVPVIAFDRDQAVRIAREYVAAIAALEEPEPMPAWAKAWGGYK